MSKFIPAALLALSVLIIPVTAQVRDDLNLPFENDSEVLGTWESVDFVTQPGDFVPGKKQFSEELYLKKLTFLNDGKTTDDWWTWTKGVLIHKDDQTASRYEIRTIQGTQYLFVEWKAGEYMAQGTPPEYYVLKKK